MNLDELRKLSPEQAMQAAAKDLSLPDNFFDRMWTQESGRGQNMRSAAGARGHFQIMPATQHAWEERDGASYNPDDFYEGLYLAQATMRENLDKFKDPVDATRAYNGGWDRSRWDNPETVGYVNALWGDQPPRLPSLKASRPAKPGTPAADALAATALSALPFPDDDIEAGRDAAAAAQRDAEKEQARKDATHFGDVVSDALRDPRVMPTWAVMSKFEDGAGEADPSYDYMGRRDKIEAGLSDEEREYLRENAKSDASEQRALAEINYRRGLNQTYSDAGAFATFTGQMVAGLADPASLLTGVAIGKAFQVGRIGMSLGRAGAVGALAAEGAAANVAIEGIADVSGEVKTSSDYAMAAAMGAAFVLPFARGVHRQAAGAEAERLVQGLQERAVDEQVSHISQVLKEDPSLTPEQAARRVEDIETEQMTRAVDEATGPQRIEPLVPADVRKEMEDEFQAVTPEPVQSARERVDDDFADTVVEPTAFERIDQLRKGEVTRQVRDTTGGTIKLSWSADGNKLPRHGSIAEALTAVHMHPLATPADKRLATYLVKVMSADGLQVDIRFTARKGSSNFDPNGPGVAINDHGTGTAGAAGRSSLVEQMMGLSKTGLYAVLHETVHVATYHRINAWEAAAGKLRADQQRILSQFQDLHERFRREVGELKAGQNPNSGALYAAKNLHEFAAQTMTDRQTRFVLSMMEGKPVAGKASNALREFLNIIRRILGLSEKHSGFDEAVKLIDQIIAMPLDNVKFADGRPVFAGDAPSGGGVNPLISRRARDTWAERMTAYARDYMARNPINMERLKTLTQKIGGVSDGLILAGSKNPIMQLVASLVTETTTGAAGRKANVAIRSHMLGRKFVGNALIDYDSAYSVWRNRNGGGVIEDAFRGEKRRQFDQAVYTEVLQRRSTSYRPGADKAVMEAADALEGLFDRARLGQVDAGVLGSGNLPTSSRGYIPQALDGIKLQAATVKDLALLHEGLAAQFQSRLGWDEEFAREFAPFYTERARRRAMGDKGIDGLASGGEGLQLIRDTLEEMQADPSMVDRARAAVSKMGQSHTKKRLDLDLLQELRPGLRMMDFFNTNPLLLARSYAKRTAGTVALTEAGIHGIRGVRELEQASMHKLDGDQPTAHELEAFRRVMAEILGTPVATAVVSNGASNLQLLVGLQRLGGLVFTQAAETFNMIHHLGFRSLLSGIGDLPRMMGEVGRLKRGAPSGNHILTSIEQYGGEIGTEMYKMVAPLDAPEGRLAEYVDQPGVLSRLLRAGGHLQSKISGFRGLMAAQHRMVAEQIVLKAARFIRDGADDIALRDMGFTPEVTRAVKADLPHIAKWDANGNLTEFDLTRVSDARTAEAFVQAVHRGTAQIIQGTFVGERTKWFHNDYMRLLLQLRTFGLTATEKQWGRTRMNHGYAYAAGMLLGQMALTIPIHLARIQLYSLGREDRDQYIKDALHPAAMTRSLMNYASMSGMTADVMELLSSVAGGWGGPEVREAIGMRHGSQATSVGRIVPIAGTLDTAARVTSGRVDKYTAMKQLPFSNLWYLLPLINLTKD